VQTPDGEGGFTQREVTVKEDFLVRLYTKRDWAQSRGPWDPTLLDSKDVDIHKALCQCDSSIVAGLFIWRNEQPYKFRITRAKTVTTQKRDH
ncbi:unnamed protein product, partial [marine sediment metagenome]